MSVVPGPTPPAAHLLGVQRMLQDKVGTLRIMFRECGAREMAPSLPTIFAEIADRWDMPPGPERDALRHLLYLSRLHEESDCVDFHYFSNLLRNGKFGRDGSAGLRVAGKRGIAPLPVSPRRPSSARNPSPRKRSEQGDLRLLLEEYRSGPNKSAGLSFSQFLSAIRRFDPSVDATEARKYFTAAQRGSTNADPIAMAAAAAASPSPVRAGSANGVPGIATVDALVAASLGHMSLMRQRIQNSELVRDAMSWNNRMDERFYIAKAPIRVPNVRSAASTTKAQELRALTSQVALATMRANDEYHLMPDKHKVPSPRRLPRPQLTPRPPSSK